MKNIIFNKNDYYSLKSSIRPQYENLGDDVYALRASSFRIDTTDLPKWLSISQFNKYKTLVGSYYMLVTRGFNKGIVKLMELIPNISRGVRTNFANISLPKETIITQETFYALPPKEKIRYTKIQRGRETLYVTKGMPSVNIPIVSRTPLKPPTIGTVKIPIGRWVEVK